MIFITGATGTVGRKVLDLLVSGGVRAAGVTRNTHAAALPEGVDIVHGDPSKAATLTWPTESVEAVLISPRAVGSGTAELLAMAADHGARRVVVISAATVEYPAGLQRFVDQFAAVEAAAKASGLAWTFLRCADFAANALAWAPQIRASGVVRGAYPDAATSPIHQRDIAAVAVRALTTDDHAGQSYVLTGPQSLDQREKVRIIGEAIGESLSFAELPPERVREAMLAQGLPEDVPDRMLGSLADYAKNPGPTTNTVSELLGRPALSFAEWAAGNAAAFSN